MLSANLQENPLWASGQKWVLKSKTVEARALKIQKARSTKASDEALAKQNSADVYVKMPKYTVRLQFTQLSCTFPKMNSLSFHAAQGLLLPKPPSKNGTKGQVQAALWLDGRKRHISPPSPCFPKVALLPREMGTSHKRALTTLKQLNSHYTIPLYSNHHLDREKPLGHQRILGNLQRLWQSSSPQKSFLRSSQICLMRNSCTVWKLTRSRKVSLAFNSTLFIQGIFPK